MSRLSIDVVANPEAGAHYHAQPDRSLPMKQLFIIVYFPVVLANVWLCLLDTKIVEGNIVVNVHGHNIDLMGNYDEAINRLTRLCPNVATIKPGSTDWNDVVTLSQSKTPGLIAMPRGMYKKDDWYLVETEFLNQDPQVILFKKTPDHISDMLFFGATAAPRLTVSVMRKDFMQRAPAAPKDLITCYDPFGSPFKE